MVVVGVGAVVAWTTVKLTVENTVPIAVAVWAAGIVVTTVTGTVWTSVNRLVTVAVGRVCVTVYTESNGSV